MSSSAVSASFTSSAVPSSSGAQKTSLTGTDIAIVIVAVGLGLLVLIIPIFVIARRRSRQQKKYEHPEECSKSVDADDSPQHSKDDLHSDFKHAEAAPLFTTTESKHILPLTESQYVKDAYTRQPSPPSVKIYYAGLPTHETHTVSLDRIAQSPKDDVGFENVGFEVATLHSRSSSGSTIKPTPLSIPEKSPDRSDDGQCSTKGTVSRKSSKAPDPGWESDDSASLYSVKSASAHFSNPSLETMKLQPESSIPIRLPSPTLLKGTDVIAIAERRDEETIIKSLPLPSLSLPSPIFNGDNGGETQVEEDETQIYNVAKLLHSRQSRLPKDSDELSRNASIVSHIERSGSITSPTDEKSSYRPRYTRLKQKRYTNNMNIRNSFVSSTDHDNSDSLSTISTPNPWVTTQVRS